MLHTTTPEEVRTLVNYLGLDRSELNSYGLRWTAFTCRTNAITEWLALCRKTIGLNRKNTINSIFIIQDPALHACLTKVVVERNDPDLINLTFLVVCKWWFVDHQIIQDLLKAGADVRTSDDGPLRNALLAVQKNIDILRILMDHPRVDCNSKSVYKELFNLNEAHHENLKFYIRHPRVKLWGIREDLRNHFKSQNFKTGNNLLSWIPSPFAI